jgi:hypothetical protein
MGETSVEPWCIIASFHISRNRLWVISGRFFSLSDFCLQLNIILIYTMWSHTYNYVYLFLIHFNFIIYKCTHVELGYLLCPKKYIFQNKYQKLKKILTSAYEESKVWLSTVVEYWATIPCRWHIRILGKNRGVGYWLKPVVWYNSKVVL